MVNGTDSAIQWISFVDTRPAIYFRSSAESTEATLQAEPWVLEAFCGIDNHNLLTERNQKIAV